MDTVPISDLRANLPTFINKVGENLKRFIVTVSGKPKAVLISTEELESLEETAEVLSIPGAFKSIEKSKEQIRKGKFISLDDLKKKYNL